MTSKLSWLSVLDVAFTVVLLELLDRGRGWGLAFGFCVGEVDGLAILPFLICIRRSGKVVPPVLRISGPEAGAVPSLFAVFSWRSGTSFRTFFVVP